MAGKRTAGSELNHDNWDEDYEPEEAGQFKRAPEEVISKRVIKVAKRRNPIAEGENASASIFSNFSGFSKSTSSASPFAFLSNLTKSPSTSNGLSTASSTSNNTNPSTTTLFKSTNSISSEQKSVEKPTENSEKSSYLEKLQGLNESVSAWIKTHVEKNPYCILTPVFKDYEKHLSEIEKLKEQKSSNSQFKLPVIENKTSEVSSHSSVEIKTNENPFMKEQKPKETISASSTVSSTSGFTFGSTKLPTTPTTGFSFGSGAPFTFSNVSKSPSEVYKPEQTKEEDEEPPKNEFTPVVEDNSIFTKRCKVFVKKDEAFTDRGVGQLFLKPVENSEKIQLIVRQDTSLGNLLMNTILSKSIPTQRMGKNNVMLVCIPDEKSKPPPVPILLRVKTAEEADELLAILEKHKK